MTTRWFGCTYNPNSEVKMKPIAESLKYNSITQLLDAASADNYKTYKVTNAIMLEQLNKVYELGSHDRQLSTRFTKALGTLAADIREEEIIKMVIYQIHQKEQHQKHRILDLLHQFQTLELNFQKLKTLKDRIMEH